MIDLGISNEAIDGQWCQPAVSANEPYRLFQPTSSTDSAADGIIDCVDAVAVAVLVVSLGGSDGMYYYQSVLLAGC